MTFENIFPWQTVEWQQIWQSRKQNRLPHALLFSGISGIGKNHFARILGAALLCVQPDQNGGACGQCRSCHLTRAETHPDFMLVEPEESGHMIKVDQIRGIIDFVNESAQQGGNRVIIMDPANAMNVNAANALLKSLEEPTPHCLFILISHQSLRLLPTIKSRCQEIMFQKPVHDVAMRWLQENQVKENSQLMLRLANGAPLKALTLFENDFLAHRNDLYQGLSALSQGKADPLQMAAGLQERDLLTTLNLLQSGLLDLLRYILTRGEGELVNFDFQEMVAQLSQKISQKSLVRYIDKVQQIYLRALGPLNLNRQLVLEELFIHWVRMD